MSGIGSVAEGHEALQRLPSGSKTSPTPHVDACFEFHGRSNEVVGVNFASAVQMGSQNNNFAIPAFRVRMLQKKYASGQTKLRNPRHFDIIERGRISIAFLVSKQCLEKPLCLPSVKKG